MKDTNVRKEIVELLLYLRKNWKLVLAGYYHNGSQEFVKDKDYSLFLNLVTRERCISTPVKCSNGIDTLSVCIDDIFTEDLIGFLKSAPVKSFIESYEDDGYTYITVHKYIKESDYMLRDKLKQLKGWAEKARPIHIDTQEYIKKLEREIAELKGKVNA